MQQSSIESEMAETVGSERARKERTVEHACHSVEPKERVLMSVRELSAFLHLGERSIWKFANTGEMPAPVRIGRAVRWDRRDIEAWLVRKRAEAEKSQKRA